MSGDPFWHVIETRRLEVPEAVLALHAGSGVKRYAGKCDITRGRGLLARLAMWCAGFPPAGLHVPTVVTITTDESGSTWQRDFGGHVTVSRLSCKSSKDQVFERFGPLRLTLDLDAAAGRLLIAITALHLFGVPLPKMLVPISETTEHTEPDGAFRFDVSARAPGIGFLIRYTGVLRPAPLRDR